VFVGGPVALAWSRFDEATRRQARARYLESIAPWRRDGGYEIPGEFVVVCARNPKRLSVDRGVAVALGFPGGFHPCGSRGTGARCALQREGITAMSKLTIIAAAAALLLASFGADAEVEKTRRAYVVSVDAKAKSVKFRCKENKGWTETTATWDDKTEWKDGTAGFGKDKPATPALAGQLKKDSKIFIDFNDDSTDQQQWRVVSLTTMPADSDME
jgi:hypothetical protein